MSRKAHKYHYLYKIVNTKTNRYYIGMHSTSNLEDGYMGGGTQVRNSIRYHGLEVHEKEILKFFENRIDLVNAEEQIINEELLNDPLCMNLMKGGYGGAQKPEVQRKWIEAGTKAFSEKIKNDPEFKKKYSALGKESIKKLYEEGKLKFDNFKGKSHSKETKEKMSIAASKRTGKKNLQFGTCWIYNDLGDKKIKKEELEYYTALGWTKGRKR